MEVEMAGVVVVNEMGKILARQVVKQSARLSR
jgi:hypothetical protein